MASDSAAAGRSSASSRLTIPFQFGVELLESGFVGHRFILAPSRREGASATRMPMSLKSTARWNWSADRRAPRWHSRGPARGVGTRAATWRARPCRVAQDPAPAVASPPRARSSRRCRSLMARWGDARVARASSVATPQLEPAGQGGLAERQELPRPAFRSSRQLHAPSGRGGLRAGSAAKSAMVKSVSWLMPVTTGTGARRWRGPPVRR